jgi:hypothetical protein
MMAIRYGWLKLKLEDGRGVTGAKEYAAPGPKGTFVATDSITSDRTDEHISINGVVQIIPCYCGQDRRRAFQIAAASIGGRSPF